MLLSWLALAPLSLAGAPAAPSAPPPPPTAAHAAVPAAPEANLAIPAVDPYSGFWAETLPNGMRVSILADPDAPIVATQTWVRVGSAHEAPNELGFAHLFEHLMFGATTNHPAEAYSRLHTVNGGDENAYTAWDNTVYVSTIPPALHDQVLQLEADRFKNLILDQENLDNEKKIVTEELRLRTENNPMSRVLITGVSALFEGHPYGHFPSGTKEQIAAADLELTRKFYAGYYRPSNLQLVIVGPVDGPATMARVRELYTDTTGEALKPPDVPPLIGHDFPDRLILKEDIPPVKVSALIFPLPPSSDPTYPAAMLMRKMLTGGEVDRFRQILVEDQGKAMEAMTVDADLRAGGILAFASVNLPTRSQRKALKQLHGALDELSEMGWANEANLETARRFLLRDELERQYSVEAQADAIGNAWSWRGDEQLALGADVAALQKVTLADVVAVWNTYVKSATPTEIVVKKGKPE